MMVEKYHLFEGNGEVFMCTIEGGDVNGQPIHSEDQYIRLEDFEKLQELFMRMHQSASNYFGDEGIIFAEYAVLIGEQNSPMDKLHDSIMEPVIERCKKALEATNE